MLDLYFQSLVLDSRTKSVLSFTYILALNAAMDICHNEVSKCPISVATLWMLTDILL